MNKIWENIQLVFSIYNEFLFFLFISISNWPCCICIFIYGFVINEDIKAFHLNLSFYFAFKVSLFHGMS